VVVTVHDLAFRLYPETAPERTRRWLEGMDQAMARATRIITPSARTRRDVLDAYGIDEDRVVTVPHGVDHSVYRPAGDDEDVGRDVRDRFGIDRPYLLYLGGIEPRKNLPRVLEAFAGLPRDVRPLLVLAGSGVRWNPEGTTALHRALDSMSADVRDRVVITGYVGLPHKLRLVQGAIALVNPTIYEGFGLQILEAMACGTPVLASDVSAMPEVAGDAALLVDPSDAEAIRNGMEGLIADRELRRRLREAGLDRAGGFDWDETARRTAGVLHDAAMG
jgi:glycosyltransferase involved in cell wall biosynthesis